MTSLFGIRNMGNTCYINSVIHCLRHNNDFKEYLLSKKFKKDLNDKLEKTNKLLKKKKDDDIFDIESELKDLKFSLIDSFSNILDKTSDIEPKTIIRPESFIKKFDRQFRERALNPQDAHEALSFLLEKFHNTISRGVNIKNISRRPKNSFSKWKEFCSKDYSEIIKIFYGQYKVIIQCSQCNKETENFEPFNDLRVELTNDLEKSLKIVFSEEEIEKRCEFCSKEENVEMSKKYLVSMFPNHLIVQVKRFTYVDDRMSKKNGQMEIPELIDLSKYYAYKNRYGMYQLYGGIVHMGSPTYGHYISFCKSDTDFWVVYDDETVRLNIKKEELQQLKENSYVLFYKKL